MEHSAVSRHIFSDEERLPGCIRFHFPGKVDICEVMRYSSKSMQIERGTMSALAVGIGRRWVQRSTKARHHT